MPGESPVARLIYLLGSQVVLEMLTKRAVRRFYRQWSPRVFAFCRLLFGDEAQAENATQTAFQGYLERDLPLEWVGIPAFLFMFALDHARNGMPPRTTAPQALRLEDAILALPVKDRAVFILRNIMDFEEFVVGEIAEIPVNEVRRRLVRSLRCVRELLTKDYFKERGK